MTKNALSVLRSSFVPSTIMKQKYKNKGEKKRKKRVDLFFYLFILLHFFFFLVQQCYFILLSYLHPCHFNKLIWNNILMTIQSSLLSSFMGPGTKSNHSPVPEIHPSRMSLPYCIWTGRVKINLWCLRYPQRESDEETELFLAQHTLTHTYIYSSTLIVACVKPIMRDW